MANVAPFFFPTGTSGFIIDTPWSPFHLVEITPVGSINAMSHVWRSSCPCLNIEIVFGHIVVFFLKSASECSSWHRTAWSQRRKQMITFWGTTPPPPPWLLLLLTSSSHNYFAKELEKKNTQSNFSCPVMKSSLKEAWNKQSFSCEASFQIHLIIFPFNHLYQLIIPWWKKRYSLPCSLGFFVLARASLDESVRRAWLKPRWSSAGFAKGKSAWCSKISSERRE